MCMGRREIRRTDIEIRRIGGEMIGMGGWTWRSGGWGYGGWRQGDDGEDERMCVRRRRMGRIEREM